MFQEKKSYDMPLSICSNSLQISVQFFLWVVIEFFSYVKLYYSVLLTLVYNVLCVHHLQKWSCHHEEDFPIHQFHEFLCIFVNFLVIIPFIIIFVSRIEIVHLKKKINVIFSFKYAFFHELWSFFKSIFNPQKGLNTNNKFFMMVSSIFMKIKNVTNYFTTPHRFIKIPCKIWFS